MPAIPSGIPGIPEDPPPLGRINDNTACLDIQENFKYLPDRDERGLLLKPNNLYRDQQDVPIPDSLRPPLRDRTYFDDVDFEDPAQAIDCEWDNNELKRALFRLWGYTSDEISGKVKPKLNQTRLQPPYIQSCIQETVRNDANVTVALWWQINEYIIAHKWMAFAQDRTTEQIPLSLTGAKELKGDRVRHKVCVAYCGCRNEEGILKLGMPHDIPEKAWVAPVVCHKGMKSMVACKDSCTPAHHGGNSTITVMEIINYINASDYIQVRDEWEEAKARHFKEIAAGKGKPAVKTKPHPSKYKDEPGLLQVPTNAPSSSDEDMDLEKEASKRADEEAAKAAEEVRELDIKADVEARKPWHHQKAWAAKAVKWHSDSERVAKGVAKAVLNPNFTAFWLSQTVPPPRRASLEECQKAFANVHGLGPPPMRDPQIPGAGRLSQQRFPDCEGDIFDPFPFKASQFDPGYIAHADGVHMYGVLASALIPFVVVVIGLKKSLSFGKPVKASKVPTAFCLRLPLMQT